MDKIKVSILVPAYNVEAYIDECLQSLLSQTLKEIEIIVVDDGSTDQTATIAEHYAATDPRIRVIRLPEHQGVSYARNVCLAQVQGEYLSFVDSDDTITSTAMEKLYHKAKATDVDIVLGSMLYCYPDGRQIRISNKSVLHNRNGVESTLKFIKENFRKTTSINSLTTSGIRQNKIEEFNKTYRNYSDSIHQSTNCESLKNELFIKSPETNLLMDYLFFRSGNISFKYNDLIIDKTQFPLPVTGTCIPFSKKMFVTVKGRILPCERINHEFALGQVTDEGVELDFEAIAKQHNDYVFRYAKQCEKCGNRTACMQCVYQIDDIHDPNTRCHGFCTEAQKEKRNEQCLRYLSEHPELYRRLLNEVVIRG